MSKVRFAYIASLIALAVLVVFTVFRPMTTSEEYTEVQREQMLKTEDQWIVQFDVINHEGTEQNYTIKFLDNATQYSEDVSIREDGMFTYIHRISRKMTGNNDATFAIYKNNEAEPFKIVKYYLN